MCLTSMHFCFLFGMFLFGLQWACIALVITHSIPEQSSESRKDEPHSKAHLWNKGPSSQGYGFSSGHVWMWELDCEESWAPKNWCFWTVVLEKTLERPLDCKEIQPVHPKGDQSWVFFGRNDAKAETPVLWPPHAKRWLIGKDSDAGRDWGQEEKGMTEDEMAGWHHRLDGRESEWTPGVGDGQGGLACCDSWGRKESDTTERLNWTELNWRISLLFLALPWHPDCLGLHLWSEGGLGERLYGTQLPHQSSTSAPQLTLKHWSVRCWGFPGLHFPGWAPHSHTLSSGPILWDLLL